MKILRLLQVFFLAMIPFAFAATPIVKNLNITNVSNDVAAELPSVNQDTVKPMIRFHNVGDRVTYTFNINYDSHLYNIESISDDNSDPYIKTDYSNNGGKVTLTYKYTNSATTNTVMNNFKMKVKLVGKNNVNPKTNLEPLIELFIFLVFASFFVGLKKYKKLMLFLIFLFPLMVYAKEKNTIIIKFDNSNVKVTRGYTVNFDVAGAPGSLSSIVCYPDQECHIPDITHLEDDDDVFVGWTMDPGGPSIFSNKQIVYDLNEGGESEVTLYAIWNRKYIVHFNGNGSTSGSMSDYACYSLSPCQLPSVGYQKEGLVFGGWATSPGGNIVYDNIIFEGSIMNSRELTLYAKWVLKRNFEYSGSSQTYTISFDGKYKLEVWGAQGGGSTTSSNKYGGKGGYSYGTINLTSGTILYVYVGGMGTSDNGSFSSSVTLAGGFNGGGYGRAWSGTTHDGGGGGGASDIRIAQDSLYARVIVAGGGGGGSDNGLGGFGGGLSGGASASVSIAGGQTNGNGFGVGGSTNYTSGEVGGGGGGWYGGYAGNSENYPGSGGSGYVYTSSTASNYPSGCLLNSSYYLTDASTIAGNTNFSAPNGGTEQGHTGNGFVRITYIEE